jgi:hypothetical protein
VAMAVARLLVVLVESVHRIVSTDSHSNVVVVSDSENIVLEMSIFPS